jgi:hypothetical protein
MFFLVVKSPAADAIVQTQNLIVQPYDEDDDDDYFLSFS